MAKTLCDYAKRDLEKYSEKLRDGAAPEYLCKKCARVAHQKKLLCKATTFRQRLAPRN